MNTGQNGSFWMGGISASGLVEISHDPASLDKPGFWAVVVTYEGQWTCARFENVKQAPFPEIEWNGISTEWSSSLDQRGYEKYVADIQAKISEGEVYQANACRILTANSESNLAGLFSSLQQENPAPFEAYVNLPELEIASASPELFLHREGSHIKSSPIKGTSHTSLFAQKDSAENIMIVDLMRNDFGRICESGSIATPRLLATEEHPGLFHLVSDVVGELRAGVTWSEIAEALLPAGSISGAPKASAVSIIESHEGVRGPYCGVVGWVNGDRASLSVGIRIFWNKRDGLIHFGTGAGITWGSIPSDEWSETELKAARLMKIARGEL
jgi:para-aminobenzoate synthetase component 1